MREIGALLRSAWLAECSYRLNMVLSILSLAFIIVPLYFVGHALQPLMGSSIASQSREYFAFALLGALALSLVSSSVGALPGALAGALGRGTFESYLTTAASPARLFVGLSAYGILWGMVRAAVLLAAGIALGVRIAWINLPVILLVVALILVAHASIGLVGGSLLLRFRTTGPLLTGAVAASALLGGVYYPTTVIPSWLRELAGVMPLTYGLRALRRSALLGEPLQRVAGDVAILAAIALVLASAGALALAAALRQARRTGTLAQP